MPFSSHWLSTLERALDLLHHGHYDEALLAFDEVRPSFSVALSFLSAHVELEVPSPLLLAHPLLER